MLASRVVPHPTHEKNLATMLTLAFAPSAEHDASPLHRHARLRTWPKRTASGASRVRRPSGGPSKAAGLPPPLCGLYQHICIKCNRQHWAQRATSTRISSSCAMCAYCQQAEFLQAMVAASAARASKEQPPPPAAAEVASAVDADERAPADAVTAATQAEGSDEEELNDPLIVLVDEDDMRAAEDAVADAGEIIYCSDGSDGAEHSESDSDGAEHSELVVDDPDRDGWTLVQYPTPGEWPGYEVISPESE